MTADSIAGLERFLGRIEQRLDDIDKTLTTLTAGHGEMGKRMDRSDRAVAKHHEEYRSLMEVVAATTDTTAGKVAKVEARLDAIEAPAVRASEARAAWRARRKKMVSRALWLLGIAWAVGEPLYKGVVEPIARSISERFLGGWLH